MFRFIFKVNHLKKIIAAVIIVLVPILIFISYSDRNLDKVPPDDFKSIGSKLPLFLINTSNCKIPALEPLNDEVLPFVKKEEYEPCSDKPLLSYIDTQNELFILKINQSVIPLYTSLSIKCCYSKILRKEGDKSVVHSSCQWFDKEVHITHPYITVTCKNVFGTIYRNVHAIVMPSILLKNNTYIKHKNIPNPLKIFMIGIDSISRLNLQRSMPKVFSYLENNFVSFKGYNKIDDNTFPNLMAILTGRSMGDLEPICMRNITFDDCDIIWKTYREHGFITAYGEDEPFLNTFNYFKKGFEHPPTDIYLRSYFLSAYLLPMKYRHLMGVCSGPENTAERMFNAAENFITVFKNNPTFALYWLNSFSHDDVNLPSSMDNKFLEFLTNLDVKESLKNSIIIIFSDHGFRYGDIRFTYSGWLEERLPFLYFKFPKAFQESHSELYENLVFNAQNRLTSPYDFHMTLKHLLKLSNNSFDMKPSLGCPSCKSFFEKIPENRLCKDGGISQHWCTCEGYNPVSSKNKKVQKVGQYIVDQINEYIKSFSEEGYKCAHYELKSIDTVGKSERKFGDDDATMETYLILVKTYPFAMFEATVKAHDQNFELLGDISRLNRYGAYSSCVNNDRLKKYCFCNGWITTILSRFCYLVKCPIF